MFSKPHPAHAITVSVLATALLLIGVGQGPASASHTFLVTSVNGAAFGFRTDITPSGSSASTRGPSPSVTLPAGGSASPVTATATTGSAVYGPTTFFSSGALSVSTQGTLGEGGSVTSSASIQTVNTSTTEVFTATSVASSCSAAWYGSSGSTTVTGGTLRTADGDPNVSGDETVVTIPASPDPNTTYNGTSGGNSFQYVFNEQTVDPVDGTITVYAAHEHLSGPGAVGDVWIGESKCGVTALPIAHETTPPETTINSGPSGTTSSASPSFGFVSSESPSTFECKLDGPGATAGSFGSCTSPNAYTSLADGSYTFSVRATDSSANTDPTPATSTFTVSTGAPGDTTAPETTINSGPSGTTSSASPSFGFVSSESSSTFECKLDGPGGAAGSFGSCSSPKAYASLADGSYTFSVRGTDAASNTDASPATRSFTVSTGHPSTSPPPLVDTTPPAAKLGGSRSQKAGKAISVSVSCPGEACRATATGSVTIPGAHAARAKLYRLKKATATVDRGGTVTLRPKLSAAGVKAVRGALRGGRRPTAKLSIVITDAAGNTTTLTRRVTLRP